jgi:hypothetical protein
MYTVKKVSRFPVPSWDVSNQTLTVWDKLHYSRPGRVLLVTSRLGTGKRLTFFYRVSYLDWRAETEHSHRRFSVGNTLEGEEG